MEMDKIRKRGNKKKTSAFKSKNDRGVRVEGVLATKIQQSIERAKYVQSARKAGWEQINKSINIQNLEAAEPVKTQAQIEKDEEDEYVKQFYMESGDTAEADKEEKPAAKASGNVFALLDEAEA